MPLPLVVSFFDYTGHAVRDWAAAGCECWCFDIQHSHSGHVENVGGGRIRYLYADLSAGSTDWSRIRETIARAGRRPLVIFAFPPCTELATSGALHWERKRAEDPQFQTKAAAMATAAADLGESAGATWLVENPRSALSTLWRSPDHKFSPHEYGGYLPEDDQHPRWPDYIAPRDAYPKETWLWVGGGFRMPPRRPVTPEVFEVVRKTGAKAGRVTTGARQWLKLGGKSLRTKNIRNESPRGFFRAVFEANFPGEHSFVEKHWLCAP